MSPNALILLALREPISATDGFFEYVAAAGILNALTAAASCRLYGHRSDRFCQFEILTEECALHTVLRLPRGMFTPYSQGVKANVVFFTKGYATETVWIYDARTDIPEITKKDRPLMLKHFAEFEKCYSTDPDGGGKRNASDSKEDRWRSLWSSQVLVDRS